MSRLGNLSELMLLAEKYGEFEILRLCIKEMDGVALDKNELRPMGKHSLSVPGGLIDVTDIVEKFQNLQKASTTGFSVKIDFIKEIRARTGCGLKEAKDYVESIEGF